MFFRLTGMASSAPQAPTASRPVAAPIVVHPQLGGPGGVVRVAMPAGVRPTAVTAMAGRNIVINSPGMRPGTPGSQITVPLQTLQGLQPGQGIPTGQVQPRLHFTVLSASFTT
jgi:hypothetical protein